MTTRTTESDEYNKGMLAAADLVDEIAEWLRSAQQDDIHCTMRGPKTKVGWLQKAAREIRARAGVEQDGVWFTQQAEATQD